MYIVIVIRTRACFFLRNTCGNSDVDLQYTWRVIDDKSERKNINCLIRNEEKTKKNNDKKDLTSIANVLTFVGETGMNAVV